MAGEVNWFYSNLGIDDTYFQNESREVISDHIIALFGAKIMAFTKRDPSTLVIDLERIDERGNGATFIHTSAPGLTTTEGPGATCEARSVVMLILIIILRSSFSECGIGGSSFDDLHYGPACQLPVEHDAYMRCRRLVS